MEHISNRYPDFKFTFGRVNVILGANGSGKSQFLTELRDVIPKLKEGKKAVYIEGGRTIKIEDVIKFDARNFQQYDKLETAMSQYESKRLKSLADRLFDAIVVLEKKELGLKSKHSDDVERWNSEGRKAEYPIRPAAPLSRVFELFSEIFPQITLSFDYEARRMSAVKNNQTYGPSKLSDGEKQVFSVLADLVELDGSYEAIIADEPELNLHPELAERLWTLIENEFQDKTFIYATHSINFALREGVNQVYVLSADPSHVAKFTDLSSLPRAEVSAFLGGLPGILSSNNVVVTEGHEKSFDAIFYRWILGDRKLEIYPAGGCSEVVGVISKSGMWGQIATSVKLLGVVDFDYKADSYSASLKEKSIIVLPVHEAEAYLCFPEILCALAKRIGSQEKIPEQSEIEEIILSELEKQKLPIAARRVFSNARIDLAVSLEKQVLAAASSKESLVDLMCKAAGEEINKAVGAVGEDKIIPLLDNEISSIEFALQNRDIPVALRYLPAKQLLNSLSPKAGFKNGMDMMRSLKNNFSPNDFPCTMDLQRALGENL